MNENIYLDALPALPEWKPKDMGPTSIGEYLRKTDRDVYERVWKEIHQKNRHYRINAHINGIIQAMYSNFNFEAPDAEKRFHQI